jgi:hypothetical protein
MTDYCVLDCDRVTDDEGGTLEVDDGIDTGVDLDEWSTGLPLNIAPKQPFVLKARAVRGYQGVPADFYNFRICLMSEKMVKALRRAGVDNLQLFPAQVLEQTTGQRWPIFAVNIIGRVAAADLAASEWKCYEDPPIGSIHFENLAFTPQAGYSLPLFRLAENLDSIVISSTVKSALKQAALTGVDFIVLADWQT